MRDLNSGYYWINQVQERYPDRWEPAFLNKDGRWLLIGEADPIDQVQIREIGERLLHLKIV